MRAERRLRGPRETRKKNFPPGMPCARACGRCRTKSSSYCRPCQAAMQRVNRGGRPDDAAYSWRNQDRKRATG